MCFAAKCIYVHYDSRELIFCEDIAFFLENEDKKDFLSAFPELFCPLIRGRQDFRKWLIQWKFIWLPCMVMLFTRFTGLFWLFFFPWSSEWSPSCGFSFSLSFWTVDAAINWAILVCSPQLLSRYLFTVTSSFQLKWCHRRTDETPNDQNKNSYECRSRVWKMTGTLVCCMGGAGSTKGVSSVWLWDQ